MGIARSVLQFHALWWTCEIISWHMWMLRKGILVRFLHACECVIHVAVTRFISSNHFNDISHRGSFGQLPVFQCHVGDLAACKVRQSASVNVMKQMCVGSDGLLFQVTHETMADLGRQQIGEEKQIEEHALSTQDGQSEDRAALTYLHEREQVHPLVLGFFEERVDPTIVPFHSPQTFHVSEHSCYHPGNPGNGFQKQAPADPVFLRHVLVGLVPCETIE